MFSFALWYHQIGVMIGPNFGDHVPNNPGIRCPNFSWKFTAKIASMSLIHRELPGFSKAEDPLSICQEKKESRL
jgi:hypothetical protein